MSSKKTAIFDVFSEFLLSEDLENQKILLMISGGVDSMVLLDLAQKVVSVQDLAVFHLNHHTGEQSNTHQLFVQDYCSKNNIKFYTDTLEETSEKNTEQYWRTQRQHLSKKAAEDFDAQRILTAHHATDLVETMIFRLTKGAGAGGLSPFDTSTKPLCEISKTAIIEYAQENKLTWVEDESNNDLKFQRNLIRKKVLPELRKITPNLEKVFIQESKNFGLINDYLEKQTPETQKEIPLKEFLSWEALIQTLWLRKIAKKTISSSELKDGLRWIKSNPEGGTYKTVGNTQIILKNNILYINNQEWTN